MNIQSWILASERVVGIGVVTMIMLILSACGDEPVELNEPQGLDTVEMFSGGKSVEGELSQKLDPNLNVEDIPNVDRSLYSHINAGAIGITKYERSRQSKKKIRDYLKGKGGTFTFDNKGTFGVTTYKAQAIRIPQGSYLAYEVQAIFVRNEEGASMLYDYGIRWECRQKENRSYWTTEPCGSAID